MREFKRGDIIQFYANGGIQTQKIIGVYENSVSTSHSDGLGMAWSVPKDEILSCNGEPITKSSKPIIHGKGQGQWED